MVSLVRIWPDLTSWLAPHLHPYSLNLLGTRSSRLGFEADPPLGELASHNLSHKAALLADSSTALTPQLPMALHRVRGMFTVPRPWG